MKTILMVKPTLETEYDGAFPRDLTGGQMGCRCFELLGIDVNHLPSFTCDSPLDEDIKQRLVQQTLDLTCGSLSGKDKKMYEQLVRERREAGQGASEAPRTTWEVECQDGNRQIRVLYMLPRRFSPCGLPMGLVFVLSILEVIRMYAFCQLGNREPFGRGAVVRHANLHEHHEPSKPDEVMAVGEPEKHQQCSLQMMNQRMRWVADIISKNTEECMAG
eukprot:symbB.v1.2.005939.t2/scaffold346.1/size246720/8